jgi:hypothetical protein
VSLQALASSAGHHKKTVSPPSPPPPARPPGLLVHFILGLVWHAQAL